MVFPPGELKAGILSVPHLRVLPNFCCPGAVPSPRAWAVLREQSLGLRGSALRVSLSQVRFRLSVFAWELWYLADMRASAVDGHPGRSAVKPRVLLLPHFWLTVSVLLAALFFSGK